jgi:hypothetical protein
MKDNRCFICKFNHEETLKTNDDVLYDGRGNSKSIPLCYLHSVEFFKGGQKVFIFKYKEIFLGKFGIESDADLINYFTDESRNRTWF